MRKSDRRFSTRRGLVTSVCILLIVTSCRHDGTTGISDEEALLAAHHAMLQAHVDGDPQALLADVGDGFTSIFGGVVKHPDKQQQAEALSRLFSSMQFTSYRNLETPDVQVSDDGTLGWVIAETKATGTRMDGEEGQDVEYVTTWINLYRKQDGQWTRVATGSWIR